MRHLPSVLAMLSQSIAARKHGDVGCIVNKHGNVNQTVYLMLETMFLNGSLPVGKHYFQAIPSFQILVGGLEHVLFFHMLGIL